MENLSAQKGGFLVRLPKKYGSPPCFEQVPHPALDSIAGKEYA
jgi:hypothetical protein